MITKEMLKRATENEARICNREVDGIVVLIKDFISKFGLDYEVELMGDYLIQTVFISNIIGNRGYSIILDTNFKSNFENAEEFIDTLLSGQEEAKKVLNHFKN